jgi:hypothetical protein
MAYKKVSATHSKKGQFLKLPSFVMIIRQLAYASLRSFEALCENRMLLHLLQKTCHDQQTPPAGIEPFHVL